MSDPQTLVLREEPKQQKSNKIPWNFKADESLKKETEEIIKNKKENGEEISMTQYVMNAIKKTNEGKDYDSLVQQVQIKDYRINELEKEKAELEVISGRKVATFKRISVGFSREEYDKIVDASHLAKAKSPSIFLKTILTNQPNYLSDIIPKQLE